jgi:hypothetical protein
MLAHGLLIAQIVMVLDETVEALRSCWPSSCGITLPSVSAGAKMLIMPVEKGATP